MQAKMFLQEMSQNGISLHSCSKHADLQIISLCRLMILASIKPPFLAENEKFLY